MSGRSNQLHSQQNQGQNSKEQNESKDQFKLSKQSTTYYRFLQQMSMRSGATDQVNFNTAYQSQLEEAKDFSQAQEKIKGYLQQDSNHVRTNSVGVSGFDKLRKLRDESREYRNIENPYENMINKSQRMSSKPQNSNSQGFGSIRIKEYYQDKSVKSSRLNKQRFTNFAAIAQGEALNQLNYKLNNSVNESLTSIAPFQISQVNESQELIQKQRPYNLGQLTILQDQQRNRTLENQMEEQQYLQKSQKLDIKQEEFSLPKHMKDSRQGNKRNMQLQQGQYPWKQKYEMQYLSQVNQLDNKISIEQNVMRSQQFNNQQDYVEKNYDRDSKPNSFYSKHIDLLSKLQHKIMSIDTSAYKNRSVRENMPSSSNNQSYVQSKPNLYQNMNEEKFMNKDLFIQSLSSQQMLNLRASERSSISAINLKKHNLFQPLHSLENTIESKQKYQLPPANRNSLIGRKIEKLKLEKIQGQSFVPISLSSRISTNRANQEVFEYLRHQRNGQDDFYSIVSPHSQAITNVIKPRLRHPQTSRNPHIGQIRNMALSQMHERDYLPQQNNFFTSMREQTYILSNSPDKFMIIDLNPSKDVRMSLNKNQKEIFKRKILREKAFRDYKWDIKSLKGYKYRGNEINFTQQFSIKDPYIQMSTLKIVLDLCEMGFDQEKVHKALLYCNKDMAISLESLIQYYLIKEEETILDDDLAFKIQNFNPQWRHKFVSSNRIEQKIQIKSIDFPELQCPCQNQVQNRCKIVEKEFLQKVFKQNEEQIIGNSQFFIKSKRDTIKLHVDAIQGQSSLPQILQTHQRVDIISLFNKTYIQNKLKIVNLRNIKFSQAAEEDRQNNRNLNISQTTKQHASTSVFIDQQNNNSSLIQDQSLQEAFDNIRGNILEIQSLSAVGHKDRYSNNQGNNLQGKTEEDQNSQLSFTVDFNNQRNQSSSFKSVESLTKMNREISQSTLKNYKGQIKHLQIKNNKRGLFSKGQQINKEEEWGVIAEMKHSRSANQIDIKKANGQVPVISTTIDFMNQQQSKDSLAKKEGIYIHDNHNNQPEKIRKMLGPFIDQSIKANANLKLNQGRFSKQPNFLVARDQLSMPNFDEELICAICDDGYQNHSLDHNIQLWELLNQDELKYQGRRSIQNEEGDIILRKQDEPINKTVQLLQEKMKQNQLNQDENSDYHSRS